MNCPADTSLLVDYANGRLSRSHALAVARHVESCLSCRDAVLGYSSVANALDHWDAPLVSMDFNRRLWRRIAIAESAPWPRQIADLFRIHSLRPVIPLAAAALMIAGTFLFERPHPVAPEVSPGVSATEADQAERTLDDLQLLRQFDDALSSPQPAKTM